jgi:ubiquinone/menaquinone biosynthesis C-methylase UbiE
MYTVEMKPHLATTLIQQIEADYNRIAGHFSQTRGRGWPIIEQLVAHYTHPGMRLLDIGCGNGRVADVADKFKLDYTGLDLSIGLINEARRLHPTHHFEVGNMTHLSEPDRSFDVLIAVASFHHIPSRILRQRTLEEWRRVLRPGGVIILINWNLHQSRFRRQRWKTNFEKLLCLHRRDWNDLLIPWKNANGEQQAERYYHGFTPKELGRLADDTGLRVITQYYELHGTTVTPIDGANLITILKRQ